MAVGGGGDDSREAIKFLTTNKYSNTVMTWVDPIVEIMDVLCHIVSTTEPRAVGSRVECAGKIMYRESPL